MTIDIVECTTPALRREFIEFQWEIYKGDLYWVPPLISERIAFYDKNKNPFFEHSDAAMFMAKQNAKTVGTIVAIQNNRHNETWNEKTGFFGGFETIDDYAVAKTLLDTAREWVKARGNTVLRGPATLTLNDECGLLVDGFDGEPQLLMTYNPRYYVDLIDRYGFVKAMDLWAWWADTSVADEAASGKIKRVAEIAQKRGRFTIRQADLKNLEREIQMLKLIYSTAWAKNWGHVPPTEHELRHLVKNLAQIADPELIYVAEINGVPAGFAVALPNVNRALRAAYPNPRTPEIWTLLKFLWYRRTRVNSCRVILLGVLPEHRMSGIDAVLSFKLLEAAKQKKYIGGEFSWILENNDAMNRVIQLAGSRIYRTYRIYDYAIE
jgi:hypothetical protein